MSSWVYKADAIDRRHIVATIGERFLIKDIKEVGLAI